MLPRINARQRRRREGKNWQHRSSRSPKWMMSKEYSSFFASPTPVDSQSQKIHDRACLGSADDIFFMITLMLFRNTQIHTRDYTHGKHSGLHFPLPSSHS